MTKSSHSPLTISQEKISSSARSRRVNLEDVSIALDKRDHSVIVAFFKQGYTPVKAPGWMKAILGMNHVEKLNEKYYLWKTGIL